MMELFHAGSAGVLGVSPCFRAVIAAREFLKVFFHTAEVTGSNPVPPSEGKPLKYRRLRRFVDFNFG